MGQASMRKWLRRARGPTPLVLPFHAQERPDCGVVYATALSMRRRHRDLRFMRRHPKLCYSVATISLADLEAAASMPLGSSSWGDARG